MSNQKSIFLPIFTIVVLGIAFLMLGGCTSTIVGGASNIGLAAFDERGIDGNARDLKTAIHIREKWFRFDHTLIGAIGLEVFDGRAMLTGAVTDEKVRADAVRLAWAANGVQDVINEIQVVANTGLFDTVNDAWISGQLSSKIVFDRNVFAINYKIETVNSIIYLIGAAQSQRELDRVFAYAREIPNVIRVVSHVRVKQAP